MNGFLLNLPHAPVSYTDQVASPPSLKCWRGSPFGALAAHFPPPDFLDGPRALPLWVQPLSRDSRKPLDCEETRAQIGAVFQAKSGPLSDAPETLATNLPASALPPDSLDRHPSARVAVNFLRRQRGVGTLTGRKLAAAAWERASQEAMRVESKFAPRGAPH